MAKQFSEVTVEFLQAFANAWNRHDVDGLMSFMTDDCVYDTSAGDDVSRTSYEDSDAVRAAFAKVLEILSDAHWGDARHFVSGDRGVSEWVFTGTQADGTRKEVNGCDILTFREGKIAVKSSYLKNRTPIYV